MIAQLTTQILFRLGNEAYLLHRARDRAPGLVPRLARRCLLDRQLELDPREGLELSSWRQSCGDAHVLDFSSTPADPHLRLTVPVADIGLKLGPEPEPEPPPWRPDIVGRPIYSRQLPGGRTPVGVCVPVGACVPLGQQNTLDALSGSGYGVGVV